MKEILHQRLPAAQTGPVRLPGTAPCAPDDWLRVDEVYAAQMAYRAELLSDRPEAVFCQTAVAHEAAAELLQEALKLLPVLGFKVGDKFVDRPDCQRVELDWAAPLWTLGHLVQEDICILQKRGDEHVLTAALLCFPANWRLAEKIDKPLSGIHAPVLEYDENIASRVQRLCDGVQVGRPLWRFNKLRYADADLHQPHRRKVQGDMPYTRSERQCLVKLPKSGAVAFTIHTYVVR